MYEPETGFSFVVDVLLARLRTVEAQLNPEGVPNTHSPEYEDNLSERDVLRFTLRKLEGLSHPDMDPALDD